MSGKQTAVGASTSQRSISGASPQRRISCLLDDLLTPNRSPYLRLFPAEKAIQHTGTTRHKGEPAIKEGVARSGTTRREVPPDTARSHPSLH